MPALTRATFPKCHPRTPYRTKADAEAATTYYKQHQVVIYRCDVCKKYHTTFV